MGRVDTGVIGSANAANTQITSFLTSGLLSFDSQAFRVTREEEMLMGIFDACECHDDNTHTKQACTHTPRTHKHLRPRPLPSAQPLYCIGASSSIFGRLLGRAGPTFVVSSIDGALGFWLFLLLLVCVFLQRSCTLTLGTRSPWRRKVGTDHPAECVTVGSPDAGTLLTTQTHSLDTSCMCAPCRSHV